MLPDAPERSEKESAQLDLSGILSGDLDKSVSRREACERERDCRVGSQGTRGRGDSDSDRSPAHSWAGATVSLLPSRQGFCSRRLCHLQSSMPLIAPLLPGAVAIKVPESMEGREGGALEWGDTRHPATLARKPINFQVPRAVH